MEAIEIKTHKGEIGREQECSHNPSFDFQKINGEEHVWYEVNIDVIQKKNIVNFKCN